MKIKDILFAGLLTVSTAVSAQSQETTRATADSLTTAMSDDYYVARPLVVYEGMPSYENPRKNSIIDLIKNQGIEKWFYKDGNGRYVQFDTNVKKWVIRVKLCDEVWYVVDRFDFDMQFSPIKNFSNTSRSKEELDSVVSYCASVPMWEKPDFGR